MSYRLRNSGYKLAFCRNAVSVHHWREGLRGYLRQQFGVGYGRLDVVARHPHRVTGDDVSRTAMMLHAPAMTVAIVLLALAGPMAVIGASWSAPLAIAGLLIIGVLAAERFAAGIQAWRHTGDLTALAFPVTHLVRDIAWSAAIVTWITDGH